jgi:hypothetical protein
VIEEVAVGVLRDVQSDQPELSVADPTVGVDEGELPGPHRLDLSPFENDPHLDPFVHGVLMKRPPVAGERFSVSHRTPRCHFLRQ